jgi:hypothetical protein
MNSKNLCAIGVMLVICLTAVFAIGQSQPTPPDLSGKWSLVDGSVEADSPLGREGTITQNGSTVTFRSSASTQSIAIPFDGSKATSQGNGPIVWEYRGMWIGFALVVSMNGRNRSFGSTFEDLMVVTPSGADTMTMVIMRTPKASGKVMHTFTATYRKS